MFVLQSLPAPTVGLCTDIELYVRPQGAAWYSFDESATVINASGSVTTDTYFGVVCTGKWFRHTTIRSIEIAADVSGDVEIEAIHSRPGVAPRIVATARSAGPGDEAVLRFGDLSELGDGHVFLRVRSFADGSRFRGMTVRTADPPARDVRVGVVITTFNRESYVRATLDRLDCYASRHPDLGERLQVTVVDNGRTLKASTAVLSSRVVPNRNLGGAGGFARGLLELRDGRWATHALFMDDDLSFEPEILRRIVAVLSYAGDRDLCVAGAMLREERPTVQFEAGAIVRTRASHIWQPVGHNRQLDEVEELLANELDEPFDYGGWWCFAFPLSLTADYPLPVFVRGDDVCFGLKYATGRMVTVNGIGVWHQDFVLKNGPAAFFYESRNLPLMLSVTRPEYDATALRKRMITLCLRFTTALKYESARAVLDGIEAFLDGPDRLLAVPSDQLNDEVRARYGERPVPLPDELRAVPAWRPPPGQLPMLWRLAAVLTVGGHLLPGRVRRHRRWAARPDTTPAMATVGADSIVFRHDSTGIGFEARRDHRQFLATLGRLRRLNARITREFDAAVESWRAAYPKLASEEYWRDQFERTS